MALLASGIEAAEADDQIAQSGEVFGSVFGAGGGLIFTEGDIAHVMEGFSMVQ